MRTAGSGGQGSAGARSAVCCLHAGNRSCERGAGPWARRARAAAQELHTAHGPALPLPGLGVARAEGDLAVPAGEDILLLDDATIEVAVEIGERLRAGAHGLAVDDPSGGGTIRDLEAFGLEGGAYLGTEDLGQGLMVEEIARLAPSSLGTPKPALCVDGPGRHDQMHVGVVVEPAGMGVQDRHGARDALKPLVVYAKGSHGLPTRLHQEVIDGALMGEREGAQ